MACNCNNADPNCEPCAFCTPPGVKCLPDCNPPDPCPEKIDLCCILYSGEDELCSDITNGEPLCELIQKFFEVEFSDSLCCELEMSIDLLPDTLVIPTTTTSSTTSTTTSTTSTTSTTTTTTKSPFVFCYTNAPEGCGFVCTCTESHYTQYSNCSILAIGCVLYNNIELTITASAGYYGRDGKCYIVNASGVITGISNCVTAIELCYSTNPADTAVICSCTGQQ